MFLRAYKALRTFADRGRGLKWPKNCGLPYGQPLTGCDNVSTTYGHGKQRHFKNLSNPDVEDDITRALILLLSRDVEDDITRALILLLSRGTHQTTS